MRLLRADDAGHYWAHIDANSEVEVAEGMRVELLQLGEECQREVDDSDHVDGSGCAAGEAGGGHVGGGDGLDLLNALELGVAEDLIVSEVIGKILYDI
jgi:hypothetical protein